MKGKKFSTKKTLMLFFAVLVEVFKKHDYKFLVNQDFQRVDFIVPMDYPNKNYLEVDIQRDELVLGLGLLDTRYAKTGIYHLGQELILAIIHVYGMGIDPYTYQDGAVRIYLPDLFPFWEDGDADKMKSAFENLIDCFASAYVRAPV